MYCLLKNLPSIISAITSSIIVNIHYFKPLNSIIYANLAKVLGKPVVLHVYFPLRNIVWVPALKRSVQLFVVLNQYMANYLVDVSIPKEKIEVIPPLIDTNKYKPMDKKSILERYKIPLDRFILLYHGRPNTVRGLMVFLHSLVSLKDEWDDLFVILSLANVKDEDLSLNDIKNFIKKYSLDSTVHMIIGKNNPVEMYNLADVVVFPFLERGAAMCPPLSVLEAMSCKKVVVCSDIQELGLKYIIKNGYNGFLIKRGEEDLIACLKNIREIGTNTLNQIAENARRTIQEEYSAEVVSKKFIEVIRKL